MSWTFHITERWEDIWNEGFQKKWLNLLDTSSNPHVFFHPALVKAWVDTYIPIRKIFPIFIWGESGDNEVFLPLILWHKNWKNAFLKVIIPVGYSDFDYHDPIFKDSNDKKAIVQFWNELLPILNKFQHDEIVLDGLHSKYIPESFTTTSEEPCPFITISNYSNIDEFKTSLRTKLRQDINRRIRKITEAGNVEYIIYDYEHIDTAIEVLPAMLKLHSVRWPNAYKAPNFHKNLIIEGLKSGIVHFSQINLDGAPISWRIGFIYKDRFYSYMPTINPEYQQFSPGKLHLIFCIEQAINRHLSIYDQLRGSELYKSEWTENFDNIYCVKHYSSTRHSTSLKQFLIQLKEKFKH